MPRFNWDDNKEIIRDLFLVQDKTHKDVASILKERHSFEVGVRQLKRKTDEWGFFKHIPHAEMKKMSRIQARRQEQLGRQTKFLRRNGDGPLIEVKQEKLDAYQKRFKSCRDLQSQSSGTPSNIVYQTPSHHSRMHGSENFSEHYEEAAREFNTSVERTFSSLGSDTTVFVNPTQLEVDPKIRSFRDLSWLARADCLNGDYAAASKKLKRLSELAKAHYKARWQIVWPEFTASVLDMASYSGCPQSMVTRIVHLLSRFLLRERESFCNISAGNRDVIELNKTLNALKMQASFCSRLIVSQRGLQIWKPILGSENLQMRILQEHINGLHRMSTGNWEREPDAIQSNSPSDIVHLGQFPHLEDNGLFLHIGDGPAQLLLKKYQALQSLDVSASKSLGELRMLRYERSQALLGVYYSFIGKFDDAEKAFQQSTSNLAYEATVEIKLHRLLWYAEHKTRVQDWEGVSKLLKEGHTVFMRNEQTSDFIIHHFPGRFESLCEALSNSVSIDEILKESVTAHGDHVRRGGDSLPSPRELTSLMTPPPPRATSIPSSQQMFPPTPGGSNSAINIEFWRQFTRSSGVGPASPVPEKSITAR